MNIVNTVLHWIDPKDYLPRNNSTILFVNKNYEICEGEFHKKDNSWLQYRWSAKLNFDEVLYWTDKIYINRD